MKTSEKLNALRELMSKYGLTAYFVPSTDPHQNEYVPACWRRRSWLSGFTGSAGDLLVTANEAWLWTDGRYFLQAAHQLKGSGITLMKMGEPGVPSVDAHVEMVLHPGQKLGVDPRVVSVARATALEAAMSCAGGTVEFFDENLVDAIWKDRPAMPREAIDCHPMRYAGEAAASKLKRIREEMAVRRVDVHVLSALDAIAWMFNLRGRDVDFNPVAISYALITPENATLFLDPAKVPPEVRRTLEADVTLAPYESFGGALRSLAERRARAWVDINWASRWILNGLKGCSLVTDVSPIFTMKSRKNATELKGLKAALVRDGAAMVRFFVWLEEALKNEKVTELSAQDRIDALRNESELSRGLSFETISAYGEHGAIVHYSSSEESNVPLKAKGIYLLDSGGQYSDGTTDITRTILLGGKATPWQKECFTRVLKGHIALAMARFPQGAPGTRLDTLARHALWNVGLDYNHGTGHGLGSYLCVHEGPQSIHFSRGVGVPLEEGNVLSNEPGYYEEGKFGIRIENLVTVTKDAKLSKKAKTWFKFETLTSCPIDTRLVERKLLTPEEKKWFNDYHRWVKKTLSPKLGAKEKKWLSRACAPI